MPYYLQKASGTRVRDFLGASSYPAMGEITAAGQTYKLIVVTAKDDDSDVEKTFVESPAEISSSGAGRRIALQNGQKSITLTLSPTTEDAFKKAESSAASASVTKAGDAAPAEPAPATPAPVSSSPAPKEDASAAASFSYVIAAPDALSTAARILGINTSKSGAYKLSVSGKDKPVVFEVRPDNTDRPLAIFGLSPLSVIEVGSTLTLNGGTYRTSFETRFSAANNDSVSKQVRTLFDDESSPKSLKKDEDGGGGGGGERDGGAGGGDSKRREKDEAATAPATLGLGEFLYKHATFAFGGIPSNVSKGKNETDADLAKNVQSDSYKWGPAQRLATVGFASACKNKATFFAYLDASKTAIGAGLDDIIGAYSGGQGEPAGWGGATVSGQAFAADADGLRDFLRLAYVSTRAGGEPSGFVAAEKMDVKPVYADFLPTDPLWKRMCLVGCISPATLIKLISPVPLGQGETATLVISLGSSAIGNVSITSAKGTGTFLVPMGLDATPGNITDTASTTPQLVGENATKIAGAIAEKKQLTFLLQNNRGSFGNATATLTEMGTTVTLAGGNITTQAAPATGTTAPGAGGAPSAPSPLAGSGAGNYRFARRAGRARTGEEPFTFLNYIRNNSGAIEQNPLKAKLVKRISGGNDVFTLIAGDTDPGYILIPIPSPGLPATGEVDVSSAATWALAAAGAPAVGAVGTSYLPVKSIEWIFDGMNQSFGPEILPDIIAIDVEPADVNADELARARGINVYTKRRGDENLIRKAWAQYLGTTNNVVGTRIYTTRGFAEAINAFQAETRRSF